MPGGLFDIGDDFKLAKSDADFGETLGVWGWKPDFYLMLPFFGPSNDRDAIGLIGDSMANPATYFTPYNYANYGLTYNKLAGSVDEYVRLAESEADPYAALQLTTPFLRETRKVDFTVEGPQDPGSLETLTTVFFKFRDPKFPSRGTTRTVRIPGTGRKLKFSFWLQKTPAPIVYIVPGLGSHRLSGGTLGLAEMVHRKGYSAVCISSAYSPEFMENASTADRPGYTPIDGHDVHVALSEIDYQLQEAHPGRLTRRALLGYSMGAFHSLYIASTDRPDRPAQAPLIHFDRYLAINPPVRLLHAMDRLDEFYSAPLELPGDVRQEKIHNLIAKVVTLTRNPPTGAESGPLPFSAVESKFLIGATFRMILRDTIYSSESRHNQGVLQVPLKNFRREPAYREIQQVSYGDYFRRFVSPSYLRQGIDLSQEGPRAQASDLRAYASGLLQHSNVRLSLNRNDFLIDDGDLAWFQTTFPADHLVLYENGGHLGNLHRPEVQQNLVQALDGLQ